MHHPLVQTSQHQPLFRNRNRLPQNYHLPLIYRMRFEQTVKPLSVAGARDEKTSLLEAVLLIADEPLATRRLAKAVGLADAAETRMVLGQLNQLYDIAGTAFRVEEIAGGFQLMTRPEYHRWVAHLTSNKQDVKLSGAAKEALAIVAYRQPIMRADVDGIRGVQSGETLRQLLEKGLVRITGRHDSLGRPVLYGTTKKFLQVFGLKSLKELPKAEELNEPENKSKTPNTATPPSSVETSERND